MTPAEQAAVRNILAELRLTRERVRHLEDRIGDLIDTQQQQLDTKRRVIDQLQRRLDHQKKQTRKANQLLKEHTNRTHVPKPLQNNTSTANRHRPGGQPGHGRVSSEDAPRRNADEEVK